MKSYFFAALAVQGGLMVVDEIIHRRRGLPRWERVGHPIDTAFFLAALTVLWLHGPGLPAVVLAGLSCVVITKDEWQHTKLCGPLEHWLHAMLFVAHPAVLFLAFLSHGAWGVEVPLLLSGVLLYQVVYWNLLHVDRPLAR